MKLGPCESSHSSFSQGAVIKSKRPAGYVSEQGEG